MELFGRRVDCHDVESDAKDLRTGEYINGVFIQGLSRDSVVPTLMKRRVNKFEDLRENGMPEKYRIRRSENKGKHSAELSD